MNESPATWRWTRHEYDQLVDCGFLGAADRVELLGGALVVREPQGAAHAMGIRMAQETLRLVFATGWDVRTQLPVALDDASEPEPDVSVVPGSFRDYLDHPRRPVLVVEIADSSLWLDREEKGSLYARARLPEYWIVNLVDRKLEVQRLPQADPGARHRWRYASVVILGVEDTISPLAAPASTVPVVALIP